LEHEAYKFTCRRINKKLDLSWFYCHNAQKGCLSKAVAAIEGEISDPKSYTLVSIDEQHNCLDSSIDRMRKEAIRILKNPVKVCVFYTWQTVQNDMIRTVSHETKVLFLDKLGKFEDIAKSLYNIKRASILPGYLLD